MALRLLVRGDFTKRLGDEIREFAQGERITEPKVIAQVLSTHPDFVLREEAPSVEADEQPKGTIVPAKVPTRAARPEKS